MFLFGLANYGIIYAHIFHPKDSALEENWLWMEWKMWANMPPPEIPPIHNIRAYFSLVEFQVYSNQPFPSHQIFLIMIATAAEKWWLGNVGFRK